jgi:hypothetical protein
MILGFFRFIVWALAAVFIVQMGWDEPLSYRFKSPVQVAMEERLYAPPTPAPKARFEDWRPLGTALDRGAYTRQRNGDVLFNPETQDGHRMGTATETGQRPNMYRSGDGAAPPGPFSR